MEFDLALKKYLDFKEPQISLQQIKELVSKGDDFIIYGASSHGQRIKQMLVTQYNKKIVSFIDFAKDLPDSIDNIKVYHTDETDIRNNMIIIASYHEMEIAKQFIEKYGLKYGVNFIFFDHILMTKHDFYSDGFGKPFYDLFQDNKDNFIKAFDVLSDEYSQDIFLKILNFRINLFNPERIRLGDLPTPLDIQKKYEQKSEDYMDVLASPIRYDLKKAIAFKISLNPYSYFDIVTPQEKQAIFNVGAYNNTSVMFSYFSPDAIVYAFEPQEEIHNDNLELAKFYKILPVNAGIWEHSGQMSFDICQDAIGGTTASSINSNGRKLIKVYSIDDYVRDNRIDCVDFIKMDIEGAEAEALKGARRTIEKLTPDLAISIYHKAEDLYKIPLLIKELHKDYSVYIDHKYFNPTESVCFATVRKSLKRCAINRKLNY